MIPNPTLENFSFIVNEEIENIRLDLFLVQEKGLSRNFIQKNIKLGSILVNGESKKPNYILKKGDSISCSFTTLKEQLSFKPEKIKLDIIYEDDNILLINKPFNMVVHPAPGNLSGTLLNALIDKYPNIKNAGGIERCGIVHRLDKDTTGIMIIAKDNDSFDTLTKDFKARSVEKRYLALAYGRLDDEGTIRIEIGRDIKNRKKISPNSNKLRSARTDFKLRKYFSKQDISLVELNLKTGRTHQIRVHLKAIHHPVVGDKLYGHKKDRAKRQMLHSFKMSFIHPKTKEYLSFKAKLPEDFRQTIWSLM